jgi:autotransporter adhesin
MNRIYKVIWNEALNCFTAVGEYAKGRGKSSKSSVSSNATINTTSNISAIKTLRLSAMGLGLLAAGFGMQANAVGTYFAGDDPAPKIYTNPLYHQTLTVQGGETVIGDSNTKNVSVTADQWDKSLTIKLDKTVDLGADGSLKTGDTLVDNSGITITASNPINNVVLGNTGLDNGGNQITNVASGVGNDSNAANIGDLNNAVAANKTKYYSVNSTAIGNANNDGATGPNAMAMGGNASATGGQAIAIGSGESGQNTAALGEQSIAIGANVVSRGGSSIAIGGDDLNAASEANLDGTANIGKNTGTVNTVFKSYTGRDLVEPAYYARNTEAAGAASIAIGAKALSEGALSTAIGVQSSSSGVASSAFGIGASASKDGSVALGAGSATATIATSEKTMIVGGMEYDIAGNVLDVEGVLREGAQVSVGTVGSERQIKNVAGGAVTAQSTDAINGSQLHATNEAVGSNTTAINGGFALKAADGNTVKKSLGKAVEIVGSNENIDTKVRNGKIEVKLNNDLDLGKNGSVKMGSNSPYGFGSTTTLDRSGLTTGNSYLNTTVDGSGVRTGSGLASTAVNGLGIFVNGPLGIPSTALTMDGLTIIGGPSITRSGGINAGNKKITNVKAGTTTMDAVNYGQLESVSNVSDSAMQTVITQIGGVNVKTLNKTNNTANFLNGKNIVLTDENGDIKVSTADVADFTEVTTGDTVLNKDGVTIINGDDNKTVTLSNKGLNNGGNRITNIGDGDALSDAVNVRQLNGVTAIANRGWDISAQGRSDTASTVEPGDKVDFNSKNRNIIVSKTADSNDISFELNNQLNLGNAGSMQIGNSIMDNRGFTFTNSRVILSSGGLNNGGNRITNVANGRALDDAVNVGQLKEVTTALDRGWDITAQGDVATQVRQGDAIDLNSRDGNIKVSRTLVNNGAALDANTGLAAVPAGANDISFDLNPDISVVSVTAGDTTINDNGLTIAGGPSITKSGIDAADNKVTNVQNGEVTAESQDAINGSQLYAQGSGISSIIGGNTVYNAEDGTFTNSNIGGTGQGNIDGAIDSIRQGTITISTNVQGNTNDIADNTIKIATNSSNITTNTTNIKTNTDKLAAGLNFGADSGATINKPVGDESVLSFTGGNNITTTAEGSNIKFDLNGNISVDSVTAGTTVINSSGITMQDGPSMTAQGLYAGNQRMTGVADGVEATDAVNYSQLSALDSRLNNNMNDLGYRIDEVEDDANAGISAAMAMSALPQAFISGKSLIGGGVSTYNGESAVAIGFSKLSNDGRWVIKVNGTADTQGNVGGAIGAGFHFD